MEIAGHAALSCAGDGVWRVSDEIGEKCVEAGAPLVAVANRFSSASWRCQAQESAPLIVSWNILVITREVFQSLPPVGRIGV